MHDSAIPLKSRRPGSLKRWRSIPLKRASNPVDADKKSRWMPQRPARLANITD